MFSLLGWTPAWGKSIHLIWPAITIVVTWAIFELRTRDALAVFLSPAMQRRLATKTSLERTILRLVFVLGCLLFGVAALMRPQKQGATEEIPQMEATADIVFVLDVSRSMLADDASPTRLARAKSEVTELVGKLEGQRVGLVVFAGRAVSVCPLTPDHSFFNTVLATIDTRSAGRGGSRIGEAIKAGIRAFPEGKDAKLMVLITDGDDQDPYTQDAAKLARDKGVKIVAIGLGSEQGSQINLVDPKTGAKSVLMHDGKPVISKLDGKALGQIAMTTEGAYIPVGTNAVDLQGILESHVKPIVREAQDKAVRFVPAERYPWMILASLACLLVALWIGAGAGDARDRSGAPDRGTP